MIEPISPNHTPEKIPTEAEENPLEAASNNGDNGGYHFNFFNRSRKKRKDLQSSDATPTNSVYNDTNAVNLQLSPEAIEKLEKQRALKQKRQN